MIFYQNKLVELYRNKLHKWFRYILPLPFNPKSNQLFHLFLCSNYVDGIRMTRNHYVSLTDNPKYSPNNKETYKIFRRLYPELFSHIKPSERPLEWKILWATIRNHEEGFCDYKCQDFQEQIDKEWRLLRKESIEVIEFSPSDAGRFLGYAYDAEWADLEKKIPDLVPQLRKTSGN